MVMKLIEGETLSEVIGEMGGDPRALLLYSGCCRPDAVEQ